MTTTIRDQGYWEQYLSERTGTYEFRCIRYAAVADKLLLMGFGPRDSVMDIGAGRQEFCRFLREQGWQGEYTPIDGSIDGTDLDAWVPWSQGLSVPDWMVAIEVIEHLHEPQRMLTLMQMASEGMVITTPNPETTDVLGMDRTHVTEIWPQDLAIAGLEWERATLFASPEWRKENDSLIGWRKR
jgi:hypothetical protein